MEDLDQRFTHLYALDVASRETRALTSGNFVVGGFDWSPDGSKIAFDHRATSDPADGGTADISIVDVASGVKTALVSNCSYNTVPIVERLGLEAEFDAVILSFAVRSMKPEPEIYRLALEALGEPDPSRAVFVDDQVLYCDGAKAVGLDTYLIFRPEEAMEGRPPNTNGHRIIEDLRQLIAETLG